MVLSAQSIFLEWSEPAMPNGIILGYMLTYSGDNGDMGTENFTAHAGDLNDTLTGLTPNVEYMFTLRASTSIGLGEPSYSDETTMEAG